MSPSSLPTSTQPGLTYGHDAGATTATATLSVEPSLDKLAADVEIVIPVYNEQQDLAAGVHRLHGYLTAKFPSLVAYHDRGQCQYR